MSPLQTTKSLIFARRVAYYLLSVGAGCGTRFFSANKVTLRIKILRGPRALGRTVEAGVSHRGPHWLHLCALPLSRWAGRGAAGAGGSGYSVFLSWCEGGRPERDSGPRCPAPPRCASRTRRAGAGHRLTHIACSLRSLTNTPVPGSHPKQLKMGLTVSLLEE